MKKRKNKQPQTRTRKRKQTSKQPPPVCDSVMVPSSSTILTGDVQCNSPQVSFRPSEAVSHPPLLPPPPPPPLRRSPRNLKTRNSFNDTLCRKLQKTLPHRDSDCITTTTTTTIPPPPWNLLYGMVTIKEVSRRMFTNGGLCFWDWLALRCVSKYMQKWCDEDATFLWLFHPALFSYLHLLASVDNSTDSSSTSSSTTTTTTTTKFLYLVKKLRTSSSWKVLDEKEDLRWSCCDTWTLRMRQLLQLASIPFGLPPILQQLDDIRYSACTVLDNQVDTCLLLAEWGRLRTQLTLSPTSDNLKLLHDLNALIRVVRSHPLLPTTGAPACTYEMAGLRWIMQQLFQTTKTTEKEKEEGTNRELMMMMMMSSTSTMTFELILPGEEQPSDNILFHSVYTCSLRVTGSKNKNGYFCPHFITVLRRRGINYNQLCGVEILLEPSEPVDYMGVIDNNGCFLPTRWAECDPRLIPFLQRSNHKNSLLNLLKSMASWSKQCPGCCHMLPQNASTTTWKPKDSHMVYGPVVNLGEGEGTTKMPSLCLVVKNNAVKAYHRLQRILHIKKMTLLAERSGFPLNPCDMALHTTDCSTVPRDCSTVPSGCSAVPRDCSTVPSGCSAVPTDCLLGSGPLKVPSHPTAACYCMVSSFR